MGDVSVIEIASAEARPFQNDTRLLTELGKRSGLEVSSLGKYGMLLLAADFASINAEASYSVWCDGDDLLFAATRHELGLRARLFPKDFGQVGTQMFDRMRKNLDSDDPLGRASKQRFPGVFDPLLAIALISQTDRELPFDRRLDEAQKLLTLAKRQGTHILGKPLRFTSADWIPEPYEHTPNLLYALEDVTRFRPMVLTYGDQRAQTEKILPLLLMNMISGAVILTRRKHIAMPAIFRDSGSPFTRLVRSLQAQTNGRMVYLSEDVKDVTRVLNEFPAEPSGRYGVVVGTKDSWAAPSFLTDGPYPAGISGLSLLDGIPSERTMAAILSSVLTKAPYQTG